MKKALVIIILILLSSCKTAQLVSHDTKTRENTAVVREIQTDTTRTTIRTEYDEGGAIVAEEVTTEEEKTVTDTKTKTETKETVQIQEKTPEKKSPVQGVLEILFVIAIIAGVLFLIWRKVWPI